MTNSNDYSCLKRYIGLCKDEVYDKIKNVIMSFISGEIKFDKEVKAYRRSCVLKSETELKQQESTSNEIFPADKPAKEFRRRKYTEEDIRYFLSHSTQECKNHFGITYRNAYNIQTRYKKKYNKEES